MKKIMITAMIVIVFFTAGATDTEYHYDGIHISETLNNGDIILTIDYMRDDLFGDLTLHYGVNGWNNIQDITIHENTIRLILPRNTWRVEFCFRSGKYWDNNNGADWYVELKNYLPQSFTDSMGDHLQKYDVIKDRYSKIEQAIYFIENSAEKKQDDTRYLKALYEMKHMAQQLLPRIMRFKDIKKDNTLEYDFQKFLSMTEGL